jgi:hypothetical protein
MSRSPQVRATTSPRDAPSYSVCGTHCVVSDRRTLFAEGTTSLGFLTALAAWTGQVRICLLPNKCAHLCGFISERQHLLFLVHAQLFTHSHTRVPPKTVEIRFRFPPPPPEHVSDSTFKSHPEPVSGLLLAGFLSSGAASAQLVHSSLPDGPIRSAYDERNWNKRIRSIV